MDTLTTMSSRGHCSPSPKAPFIFEGPADSFFFRLDRAWPVRRRFRKLENVLRSLCLCVVLPFALAAAVLYPQYEPALIRAGSYFHYASVAAVLVATVLAARSKFLGIALFSSVVSAFLISATLGVRTPYLMLLMLTFLFAGMALARFERAWLRQFVLGLGAVSLAAMILQVFGWPSWINGLATHGVMREGDRVVLELQSTLFVPATDLKAVAWQTRPAGVFASNQFNTLFFFVLFAVGMATAKRGKMGFATVVLLAVYCALTLAKSALCGTVVVAALLPVLYGRECVWKSATYVASLAAALAVYSMLFPGVVSTYLSPYVLLVSALARAVDLLSAIGLQSTADFLLSAMHGDGILARAAADTAKAYVGDLGVVDYDKLGSTSLYSAMARQPAISAALIAAALAIRLALYARRREPIIFGSFETMILLGMFCFTFVADISTLQAFWLFVGFGAVCLYGDLVGDRARLDTSSLSRT